MKIEILSVGTWNLLATGISSARFIGKSHPVSSWESSQNLLSFEINIRHSGKQQQAREATPAKAVISRRRRRWRWSRVVLVRKIFSICGKSALARTEKLPNNSKKSSFIFSSALFQLLQAGWEKKNALPSSSSVYLCTFNYNIVIRPEAFAGAFPSTAREASPTLPSRSERCMQVCTKDCDINAVPLYTWRDWLGWSLYWNEKKIKTIAKISGKFIPAISALYAQLVLLNFEVFLR